MKMESKPREQIFTKPFEAFVTSINGKEGMYHLRGHVKLDEEEYRFRGVAFGRFGGHNVSVKFLKNTKRSLEKKGLTEEEIQDLEIAAQVKIVQGEMTVLEQKGKSDE